MKKIFTIILKLFYFFGFRLETRRTVKNKKIKQETFIDGHRKED